MTEALLAAVLDAPDPDTLAAAADRLADRLAADGDRIGAAAVRQIARDDGRRGIGDPECVADVATRPGDDTIPGIALDALALSAAGLWAASWNLDRLEEVVAGVDAAGQTLVCPGCFTPVPAAEATFLSVTDLATLRCDVCAAAEGDGVTP